MHRIIALAAVALGLVAVAPAVRADFALTITPTFDSSIAGDPNATAIEGTINSAIAYYDSTFTTKFAPINVAITFQKMSSGLGESIKPVFTGPYTSFIAQLTAASSGDAIDTTALAHLPAGLNNPVTGTALITIGSANAKALGLNVGPVASDGTIRLNTNLTTPGSPGSSNLFSLLAVTEHEIDEILGFGSAINTQFSPFPQDLFRYDNTGARSFTANGDNAFFSLDGTTDLVQFNQDGVGDFGDWHIHDSSGTVRVQDAYATAFSNPTLVNDGGAEVTTLDAIGYNLHPTTSPVPAPPALVLVGLGAGCVALRRYVGCRATA
jgi:hypothetical protein